MKLRESSRPSAQRLVDCVATESRAEIQSRESRRCAADAGPADNEVRGDESSGEAEASLGCSAVPNGTFHHVRLELGPKGQSCSDRADEYRVRVETSDCPDPRLQRRSLISCRIDAGKYSDEITATDEVPQGGIELGIVAAGNHASGCQESLDFMDGPHIGRRRQKGARCYGQRPEFSESPTCMDPRDVGGFGLASCGGAGRSDS